MKHSNSLSIRKQPLINNLLLKIWLIMVISMVSTKVSAHDIAVNNSDGITIYYIGVNDYTELAVSCRGNYYHSYENEYSGNVVIPETVEYLGKLYPVTSIAEEAFKGCEDLTSITIPNSVTTIEDGAFQATGLTSVNIPNSVTRIGDSAFAGCKSLTNISIPNSVTSVGFNSFGYTAWYKNQPDGMLYLGNVAYVYKGTMPTDINIIDGTLVIADYAFANYASQGKGLNSIIIPSSVKHIGLCAFRNCTNLSSIYCWSPNPTLKYGAFENCNNLNRIYVLSDKVESYKNAENWSTYTSIISPITLTNNRVGGDYWSTFYYSGSDALIDDENAQVYTVSVCGSTATLNEVQDKRIKAGEAVVIKSSKATTELSSTTTVDGTYYSSNDLQGVDVTTTISTSIYSNYAIYTLANESGVGFYKYYQKDIFPTDSDVRANRTLGANRAFLVLNSEVSAGVKAFLFEEIDNNATTIIDTRAKCIGGKFFDLQGRQIGNPTTGLFIIDGKKVVIK